MEKMARQISPVAPEQPGLGFKTGTLHRPKSVCARHRLKKRILNHLIQEHQNEHADIHTTDAQFWEKLNPNSWPLEILQAEIRTTIPSITSRKTSVKQFWGLWVWKRLTSTTQQHPEYTSTLIVRRKKSHKKWRMQCQHQASRQSSSLCVSTWWDTVFKLQSWSLSTAKYHRNHQIVGREAQENSLSHKIHCQLCKPSCLTNLT